MLCRRAAADQLVAGCFDQGLTSGCDDCELRSSRETLKVVGVWSGRLWSVVSAMREGEVLCLTCHAELEVVLSAGSQPAASTVDLIGLLGA